MEYRYEVLPGRTVVRVAADALSPKRLLEGLAAHAVGVIAANEVRGDAFSRSRIGSQRC